MDILISGYLFLKSEYTSACVFSRICTGCVVYSFVPVLILFMSFLFPVGLDMPGSVQKSKTRFLVSSDRASDFAFLAVLIQAAFVDVNTFSLFTTPFLCLFLFKPNFLHTFVLFILLQQVAVVSELMTISASGERCFFVVCTISFIFANIILFSLASFPSLVPLGEIMRTSCKCFTVGDFVLDRYVFSVSIRFIGVVGKFNKKIYLLVPLRAVETFKRKRVGQTAVSDNQSSSVTLNKLEKTCQFWIGCV